MEYIVFFVFIFILLVIITYNSILSKENKLKNSLSSLDVILKKRFDLVPNLVSVVKKYAEYESNVLKEITTIRKSNAIDLDKKFTLNNEIDMELKTINLLVEKYPNLKASKNFIKLQESLSDLEDEISAARRTYNAHCTLYNTFIEKFPINLFAFIFGFKKYDLFEIPLEEKESKIWI